jgi:hypothetical protein
LISVESLNPFGLHCQLVVGKETTGTAEVGQHLLHQQAVAFVALEPKRKEDPGTNPNPLSGLGAQRVATQSRQDGEVSTIEPSFELVAATPEGRVKEEKK